MSNKEQTSKNGKSNPKAATTNSKPTTFEQDELPQSKNLKARIDSRSLSPSDVVHLQRMIGNKAVGEMIARVPAAANGRSLPIGAPVKLIDTLVMPGDVWIMGGTQGTVLGDAGNSAVKVNFPEHGDYPVSARLLEHTGGGESGGSIGSTASPTSSKSTP